MLLHHDCVTDWVSTESWQSRENTSVHWSTNASCPDEWKCIKGLPKNGFFLMIYADIHTGILWFKDSFPVRSEKLMQLCSYAQHFAKCLCAGLFVFYFYLFICSGWLGDCYAVQPMTHLWSTCLPLLIAGFQDLGYLCNWCWPSGVDTRKDKSICCGT